MGVNVRASSAADDLKDLGSEPKNGMDDLSRSWTQAVALFNASPAGDKSGSGGVHYQVLVAEGDGGPGDRPPGAVPPAVHPNPAFNPKTDDPNFVPPAPYNSQYTTITSGIGSDQQQAVAALEAPLDAATLLANNWNRWNLGEIDWAHPPTTLPPEALNALAYIESNRALLNAIKAGGDNGNIDGPITKDSLSKFVGRASVDLDQATKDFQAWQKANPNADATATELARSAALLEANATLLSNAAGSSQPGWSGNVFNAQDLLALASNNPDLSPELTAAAKLWSDPGMLRQIDQAGQSPLSVADGLVNAGNIGAWLTSNAPGGPNSVMDFFNLVASRDAVINVDTSKLTSDVFEHPENYSAEQKAAVLQELKDTQDRMTLDNQLQVTDVGTQEADGINPNLLKTNDDLQSKIDLLSADPGVQDYLSKASTSALQSLVSADPGLKNAFSNAFAKFESGQTLNDDLNAKDAKGNQVAVGMALHTYVAQAGFFQLAMGQKGSPSADLDLTAIAKKSGSYDKLADYYSSEIVSGKRLQELLDSGEDPVNASAEFSQEVEAFGNVIDPAVVKSDATALQNNFQDVLSEHVFESLTPQQIETVLGDGHGNLDEKKVKQFITDAGKSNPDLSGSVDVSTTHAGLAFHLIKAVWDLVRSGERLVDVLKTAGKMSLGSNAWHDAYKVGYFHGATAILGGLYLGLSLGGHRPTDPGQITADVGVGINTFGVLTVGAGRFIRSIDSRALADAKQKVADARKAKDVADHKVANAQADLDAAFAKLNDAATKADNAATDADRTRARDEYNKAHEWVDSAIDQVDKAKSTEKAADEALKTAKDNLTKVKNTSSEIAKQKAPAVGRNIGGVGNVVTGVGLIIYGDHLRKAGEVALGNINIAQGAFMTAVGTADALDGTIKFLGGSLGKITVPRVWGMATLGDLAPIISTSLDVLGAIAGLGLTAAGVALQLAAEKRQAVNETRTVDATLNKYGLNGGPTTFQDITGAGPLGDLTPLPSGTAGSTGVSGAHSPA
ncbi:type III effector HrpK domain-containing protein [Bradyrhizobium sp. STM 3557]|uniref:type III effector HrpK domain-containing protein n=1 Tax=Bradyrhizobium sp. STM 3557 TaxID=578920 RepID=UPI0038905DB2